MKYHANWQPESFNLIRGPQDGAKVKRIGEVMPDTIYVGRKWMGDGYAAWSSEPCDRFPCCYVMNCYRFIFRTNQVSK
jgi:hypothetical protein